MASNKHHELTKLVMAQVSDLLTDYSVRQTNSFVNTAGVFPKIIKFDYLGKWRLKGKTNLLVEAGLEIAADYTYFNRNHTWINTKRKYYISNFGCYRDDLVPYTNEAFRSKTYELTLTADGQVDVGLIRHELIHYFLPYLEKLTDLNDLITFMHWHKPADEKVLGTYRHHSYFYNWLTIIYLLLTEERSNEAELFIEKIIHVAHSIDRPNPHFRISESLFVSVNKLQQDFAMSRSYNYDEEQRRIVFD